MRRKYLNVILVLVALVSACGGGGDSQGEGYYNAYQTAQSQRDQAETRLRQAFSDISAAAQNEDRAGVIAAAKRGQDAAADIDRLLAAELDAARGLAGVDRVAADAKRLTDGLQLTRNGLALVAKELEIALDDPLLAERRAEVNRLARESTDLAARGEDEIQRADRAIARALGITPGPHQLSTTTG
jgi:hypothetical protein